MLRNSVSQKKDQRSFFDEKYKKGSKDFLIRFFLHNYGIGGREIAEIFDQLTIGGSSMVLDIGCGDMPLCYLYRSNSLCFIVGVDLSRGGLRLAKSNAKMVNFNDTFEGVIADAESLPFRDGVFDSVVHSMTLEHLSHPGIGINEISKVLKKEGKVFIYTVNKSNLFRELYERLFPQHIQSMKHKKDLYFTWNDVKIHIEKGGLRPVGHFFVFNFVSSLWDFIIFPKFLKFISSNLRKLSWVIEVYGKAILPILKVIALVDLPLKQRGNSSTIVVLAVKA